MLTYLRIGAIAAVAALIGYLLWREKYLTDRLAVKTRELTTATAMLSAERDNARRANESATRHQTRADGLEAARRNDPLPAVRVCRRPASVPQAGATAVAGEAAQADDAGADAGDRDVGRDIGPALDDFATDAEANLIQCEELIRWVREG